jgi:hypothetical protein
MTTNCTTQHYSTKSLLHTTLPIHYHYPHHTLYALHTSTTQPHLPHLLLPLPQGLTLTTHHTATQPHPAWQPTMHMSTPHHPHHPHMPTHAYTCFLDGSGSTPRPHCFHASTHPHRHPRIPLHPTTYAPLDGAMPGIHKHAPKNMTEIMPRWVHPTSHPHQKISTICAEVSLRDPQSPITGR